MNHSKTFPAKAATPPPTIITLALGAAALGGPDALRALVEFTGQSPCLDIAICMFVMFMVTAYLLGAVLLVRFVRDARPGDAVGTGGSRAQGHGAASATDCLAQVSLLVAVCVGFLVAACLVALPPSVPSGGLGKLSFLTNFADKNSFIAVAVIAAAAAAASCTRRRLHRFIRGAGNAGDAAPAARASERFSRTRQTVCFIFIALLLAAASSATSGGLDAQRLFSGFPCRSAITKVPVGVAIAAVAGTTLFARFPCWGRNAAVAAAPTPANAMGTWWRRFGKLTSLAVVAPASSLWRMRTPRSQSGSESEGGEHANSLLEG